MLHALPLADVPLLADVTEGYKTGPSQAVPTPPRLPHLSSSSYSNASGTLGTSYSSSDAGSLRSTYTNPALSTSSIFLSSSDALAAAKTEIQQDRYRQQLEREQIALLNSLKPRRDLMCLADVVDVDAEREEATASRFALPGARSLANPPTELPRPDNYHLHVARTTSTPTVEEEPYHPERGRKRQTVEEDEGEATEVEDDDDMEMDVETTPADSSASHRPIRPIKRSAAVQQGPDSRTAVTGRNRTLRPTQSAPVARFRGFFGEESTNLPQSWERDVVFGGGLDF